jgi:hypothetical protein
MAETLVEQPRTLVLADMIYRSRFSVWSLNLLSTLLNISTAVVLLLLLQIHSSPPVRLNMYALIALIVVAAGVWFRSPMTAGRSRANLQIVSSVSDNLPAQPAPSLELADTLRRSRSAFIGVGLVSCLINILMLTGPLFMLQIYDRVLPSHSVPTLVGLDELHPDQPALLRFSSFNLRTTPELNGSISWIAPDQTEDQRTGSSYYTARIAVSDAEVARLHNLKIIPGMPVEVFIQTQGRTMLSYLFKPLTDQIMRTFRES